MKVGSSRLCQHVAKRRAKKHQERDCEGALHGMEERSKTRLAALAHAGIGEELDFRSFFKASGE